jgi:hypothetical protein
VRRILCYGAAYAFPITKFDQKFVLLVLVAAWSISDGQAMKFIRGRPTAAYDPPPEEPMELFEVMRTTFAAREFTDARVPDEVLYDVLENARFAPSGGNRQGNRVIVVRDEATREALGKLAEPAAKRYTAQRAAGESPWNSVIPPQVSEDRRICPSSKGSSRR